MGRNTNKYKNTFKNKAQKKSKATSAKSGKSNKESKVRLKLIPGERTKKVAGLTLLVLSLLLFLSFISHLFAWKGDFSAMEISASEFFLDTDIKPQNLIGKLGAFLSHLFITKWFGVSSFLFILMFVTTGLRWFADIKLLPEGKIYRHSIFLIVWLSVTLGFIFRSGEMLILGGTFGYQSNEWLSSMFGEIGTGFILFFILLVYLILSFSFVMNILKKKEPKTQAEAQEAVNQEKTETNETEKTEEEFDTPAEVGAKNAAHSSIVEDDQPTQEENPVTEEDHEQTRNDIELTNESPQDDKEPDEESEGIEMTVEQPKEEKTAETKEPSKEHYKIDTPYDPTLELRDYQFPHVDLLEVHGSDMISVEKEELETNKNKILNTLNNYNIEISKIKATIGPTITLYEIVPAPGVRISKIKNLEDDIALSLSALGIRIIAPIPGRGTIGIEVPNSNPETVSMRTVIQSSKFQNSKFALPVAIGKTISNESYVFDLSKMPHLLMAGATGQGKSVGLNAIIASLLYKKHPSQLKFVMVDPKKVELSLFSKIERHYLAKLPDSEEAIITDTQKVVKTLNSLTVEMDQRYELLKNAHTRNIKEYNTKFVDRKLNPEQ
ncbi:MAG: DNA translocase FtsK 4TM domain-containing protein, partial [Bacteroidota bacterium]